MKYRLIHPGTFLVLFLFATSAEADPLSVETASYGAHGRQQLDVVSPRGVRDAPVLVFFHGGGWIQGDKRNYRYVQRRLAGNGLVTVSANYRLCPEVQFPAFVEDAARSVAWTVDHIADHGGDPRNIFLMGHSAGGHTVAMLGANDAYLRKAGVDPEAIRGVITLSAPLMLRVSEIPQLSLIFGSATDREMWPLAFIDRKDPPFLLLQGERDPLVLPHRTRGAERIIREKGCSVRATYFDHHDHMSTVAAFLERYEKNGNVLAPVLAMVRDHRRN